MGVWDDTEQRDGVRQQYLSSEQGHNGGYSGLDGGKSEELKDASGYVVKVAVQGTVQRIKVVYDSLPAGVHGS